MKTRITRIVLPAFLLLAGCSLAEREGVAERRVEVTVNVADGLAKHTRAFSNTHTVDRVLLLPLVKKNEAGADIPENFTPDFAAAKQIDVAAFPVQAVTLSLIDKTVYRVLAIGFNQADYDRANPSAPGTRFAFGQTASPATLAGLYLIPSSPLSVPGFFSCFCTAAGTPTFIAARGVSLSGDLKRIVSGLSLQIMNIPDFVTSITLLAERLVTACAPADGLPVLWQTDAATTTNVLGVQAPASASVSFDVLMLANIAHPTKFYLDIAIGGKTVRYEVKVTDHINVSSSNAITFAPNYIVSISGDYANIDNRFTIDGLLNLDTDIWDGLP